MRARRSDRRPWVPRPFVLGNDWVLETPPLKDFDDNLLKGLALRVVITKGTDLDAEVIIPARACQEGDGGKYAVRIPGRVFTEALKDYVGEEVVAVLYAETPVSYRRVVRVPVRSTAQVL